METSGQRESLGRRFESYRAHHLIAVRSDEQRPLHLQASDAVMASRKARERAEARGPGPDVSSKQSTPAIVWGAFLGLIISAFQVDPKSPLGGGKR